MLKKQYRLTKQNDFERLFKTGSSFFGSHYIIKVCKNKLQTSRFVIIVSNKISKKAVERNTLKRRIREVVRKYLQNIQLGYDVAIISRKESVREPYENIQKQLQILLKRAKIWKNEKE